MKAIRPVAKPVWFIFWSRFLRIAACLSVFGNQADTKDIRVFADTNRSQSDFPKTGEVLFSNFCVLFLGLQPG
jgi:hypothetical protein